MWSTMTLCWILSQCGRTLTILVITVYPFPQVQHLDQFLLHHILCSLATQSREGSSKQYFLEPQQIRLHNLTQDQAQEIPERFIACICFIFYLSCTCIDRQWIISFILICLLHLLLSMRNL